MSYETPIHLGLRYGLRPQTQSFPNNGHRSVRLFEEFGLSDAIALHPYAYRRIIDQGLGISTFMRLTRASAAALDACWEGHNLTPNYNGYCGSRNSIIWPEGEYWLNYTYELSSGVHLGAGTNGFYGSAKASTQLTYWHEQWLAPAQNALGSTSMSASLSGDYRIGGTASERHLVRNVNWGDSGNTGYHEGFVFDGFRLSGTRAGVYGSPSEGYRQPLFDPWTPVHGLCIWKAGEASEIGRVYTEGFNGYGVMLVGGTPVFARTISTFNNNVGGIGFMGTALATFNFGTISGDDNPVMLDLQYGVYGGEPGGQINIGLLKLETATSGVESEGWYWKGQIAGELRGQFSVNIGTISYAVGSIRTDAAFTVDSRLSPPTYYEQSSNLRVGSMMGYNYKSIVHDTYKNKAWLSPGDYNCFGFEWNYIGSATGGVDRSFISAFRTLTMTAHAGTSRLGWLRVSGTSGLPIGTFDYAGATPYYSYIGPTGSTGSTGSTPTPGVTAVDVWPESYNVAIGGTTLLYATVEGTGAFGGTVSWSVVSGPGYVTSINGNPTTYVGPTSGGATSVFVKATSDFDVAYSAGMTLSIGTQSAGNTGSTGATVGLLANYTFGGTSVYYITGTTGPVLMPSFTWMSASSISGGKLTNRNYAASYPIEFDVVRKIILRGLKLLDTNPRRQHLFSNISISDSLGTELNGQALSMNVGSITPGVAADITINIPAGTPITHFLCGLGQKSAASMELDGLEIYDWI